MTIPRPAGAIALVIGSQCSLQLGAAFAVLLFPTTGALGTVALRLGLAALLLVVLSRPSLRNRGREQWLAIMLFGTALAGMNLMFYLALDRIPLGATVTIELMGPLLLTVLRNRRAATWCWAGLALTGVLLLGAAGFHSLNPAGVLFAIAAGGCWAGYILLSHHTARQSTGSGPLALSVAVSALLVLPFGVVDGGGRLLDPSVLALGLGVAVLSSALPYRWEMRALRTLPAGTFAVLLSLSPALGAWAGALILGQTLATGEVLGIALVVLATAGGVYAAGRPQPGGPVSPATPATAARSR